MRARFAAALACGAVGLAHAPFAARAASQDFTLVNRTGFPIASIYLAEPGNPGWGNDVMGRDTLFPGERVAIAFDRDTRACRWNVMVEYRDRTRAIWTDVNLCEVSRFALFYDRTAQQMVARAE